MAILQISRIQSRRGLHEDLPQPLASAEFGWCLDTRRLFIGNGDTTEGAPQIGNTEILTTESNILDFESGYVFKGVEAGGYIVQTGPSALAPANRSMQNKFDDIVNFRDFGGIGDGSADDVTAFNRAIEQLHAQAVLAADPRVRRTLHIPAGVYKLTGDVIKMLPYVKLKGDGKNATYIIQTDNTQDCTLTAIGTPSIRRGNLEIEDLTLANTSTAKDVIQFDGVKDAYLSRVRMQLAVKVGGDPWSLGIEITTDNNSMPIVAGSGTSCVKLDASVTGQQATSGLVFNNCDFVGTTYGISAVNSTNGISNVSIVGGYFNKLYQGLALGNNDNALVPLSGIKITHSTFDEIFRYAIQTSQYGTVGITATSTTNVVSAFNSYLNVGRQGSASPGSAVYPVLDYNGKNSYSIGDSFEERLTTDAVLINLHGLTSFATLSNGGLQLGLQQTRGAAAVTLADNASSTVVIGVGYNPIIIDYAIVVDDDKRTGVMKVTTDGVDVTYDDEYVESADFGISMVPSVSGDNVILTYDTNASTIGASSAIFKITTRTFI